MKEMTLFWTVLILYFAFDILKMIARTVYLKARNALSFATLEKISVIPSDGKEHKMYDVSSKTSIVIVRTPVNSESPKEL